MAAAEPAATAMKVVEVDLGDRTYPIYIGRGLLDQGELLRQHIPGKTALIVTNETIAPLYLERYVEPTWCLVPSDGAGTHWPTSDPSSSASSIGSRHAASSITRSMEGSELGANQLAVRRRRRARCAPAGASRR